MALNDINGGGLASLMNGPGTGISDPLLSVFPLHASPIVCAPSPVINELRLTWLKVDTVWGGTDAMRLAGKSMLPQEPFETDDEYAARLKRSCLVNYYKNTIQDAAGRVFAKDIRLVSAESLISDDGSTKPAQPEFQLFSTDVDAYGNNITQFSKYVFEQAVNHGVSYILVDYPRVPLESAQSLESQVETGARPYWVHVPANRVLDYRSAMIDGKQRPTLFRYEETIHELSSDGFTPASYQQVRIFKHEPGSVPLFAVYRRKLHGLSVVTAPTSGASTSTGPAVVGEWELVGVGRLTNAAGDPLPGIPVAAVYTNRVGYGLGKPALEDLADLNITHYQAYSDYQNINHIANVPFLFGKGLKSEMDQDGKKLPIILSPGKAMVTDSIEGAELSWVEHTGKSIESAAKSIESIEKNMKECGLKLTQEVAPQGRSATEALINVAESNSRLKSFALALQDALNLALFYTSEFFGIPDASRAKVNTEFADVIANPTDMQYLVQSYKEGAITADTLIYEMKRRNVIDPSTSPKAPVPVVEEVAPPESEEANP